MDPLAHQVAKRCIYLSLAIHPAEARERWAFDRQCEMAFAAGVVAGVADVLVTLILKVEAGRGEGSGQPLDHFAGDRSGGSFGHRSYIGAFGIRGTSGGQANQMAWAGRRV